MSSTEQSGEFAQRTCGVRRPSSTYFCLRPQGHDDEHRSHLSNISYAFWLGADGVVGYRSLPMPPEDFGSSAQESSREQD